MANKVDQQQATRNSVLRQLAALQGMTKRELEDKWRDLFGTEPPRFQQGFLQKRLAYRIQELFYGGISTETKEKLREMAANDPTVNLSKGGNCLSTEGRLLPGTRLIREWRGKNYEATILKDGIEYGGQCYRSLTAVVKAITGAKWNGPKWWGLPESHNQKSSGGNNNQKRK